MANEFQGFDSDPLVIVGFELGGEAYGLPIECVREIIRRPQITKVPHAGKGVIGIRDLRGTVIPMLDLSCLLGITDPDGEAGKVIIVEDEDMTVGLLVNEVHEVQAISLADISRPEVISPEACGGGIAGVARQGERLLKILNWRRIVSPDLAQQLGNIDRHVQAGSEDEAWQVSQTPAGPR